MGFIWSVNYSQRTEREDILNIKTKKCQFIFQVAHQKNIILHVEHKKEQNMVIFEQKIAKNLQFERFLVIFFTSKVENHMAVNGYTIFLP